MKRLVLHNVFGLKNLGDEAIYKECLRVLDEASKDIKIELTTFCLDLPAMTKAPGVSFKISHVLSPYGFVILSTSGFFGLLKKYLLFLYIVLGSIFLVALISISKSFLPQKYPFKFITEIYQSDIFFGMGGGYLRTKSKYADYFGLLLTVTPIFIAKFFRKKIMYFPMSFGDFATKAHKKISYWAVINTTIYLRDENSLALLNSIDTTNLVNKKFSPDLALYSSQLKDSRNSKKYIVLTARDWLPPEKQQNYELSLAMLIDYVYKEHGLQTNFIPMATHETEDDDKKVFYRLSQLVKDEESIQLTQASDPSDAKSILSSAQLAICTRMHSAIFSAAVNTPFIAIAYESKTNGFMKLLNLEQYLINIEEVTFPVLQDLFSSIMKKAEKERVKMLVKTKLQGLQQYREELVAEVRKSLSI